MLRFQRSPYRESRQRRLIVPSLKEEGLLHSAPVVIGDNVRRITATPFQFGLFYVVEPDLVDVLRVLHLSRSPANWPE